jgi:tetratricopeptide (TPR) repeat protein/transglutaminase-like putative cysteine protease
MIRSLSILLCAALSLSSSTTAQQQQATPGPQVGLSQSSTQKSTALDFSQEPFIIEKYSLTTRFENDGTGERALRSRIKVQSDAGVQQLGDLIFGYNSANEKIDVHFVRVVKPDGSVVATKPDAVKEMTAPVERDAPEYTDYKELHVTVPDLHPGDVIEYEIATHLVTPVAPGQFWFEQNFLDHAIVLDEQLEVNVPQGRALLIQSADFSNVTGEEVRRVRLAPNSTAQIDEQKSPFSSISENGRTIYRWRHANLTVPNDDLAEKKLPPPKIPDVQLTTYKNWNEVAAWYAALAKGRNQPTPEIRAKAAELTAGRSTDLDKMQALYNYVAKNIRYVSLSFGLGRYQPHTAAEVFKNQYGDCKDKDVLLSALLQSVGISSDPALIPLLRPLDPAIPSPAQFDHLITAARTGSDIIWMDSTAEVAPFRLLIPTLRDKSALIVLPDGQAKIATTPADPPFLSTQHVEIDAQVSDLGKLTAKLRYFLRGDNEVALRLAFRRTPQNEWPQLGQTIAALDGIRGNVTNVKPSDPTDTAKPFELDLDYEEPSYLDWAKKKTKVPVPLLSLGMPHPPANPADPIHLGSPLDITTSLKLTLPANFTAQTPVGVSVARDYAEFKSVYRFENHVFTAERVLNFKMNEIAASRAGDYDAFSRAVESDENQTFIVENSATGVPEIPSTAKPEDLVEAGAAALNSGNPREAIPLLQRAVEIDPKSKQGFNDLGLAYLRTRQFTEAEAAFHHQLEVNPFDEHANNYLGLTLQQDQKFPEAEAAYRKQLEITPLDPVTHAALGALFLEQHKYAEAVPELDKAAVLAPESAELQISLGRALLGSGQKEKALEAFQKGIDLSHTPAIWNNVAYDFAVANIELDRAAQYAESAISTTDANLRNIQLAHLSTDDLNQVTNIGVYWDTLGWVNFKKGDLDKAERFVRAAWLLNQQGDVGDHLAQIYEKRGQKQEAIRLYSEAIAAPHSDPESRARLTLLLGENSKIDALVAQAKTRLAKSRTFPAGKLLAAKTEADFFVLLAPGTKSTKVEAAKFISGNPDLRPFAENLRTIDFGPVFPDPSPSKIIRRGTLSCTAAAACTFTLALPETVRTVN